MEEDELNLEETMEEEEAYVEYDIATYPSDYTLDGLRQLVEDKEIVIPPYQRKYVWKIEQASLLVESFLIGLPVPPIFLYITEENKSEVIDGQQRLISMVYFMEGYFGEPDAAGRRKVFRLAGLSEKSPYSGKSFERAPGPQQRLTNARCSPCSSTARPAPAPCPSAGARSRRCRASARRPCARRAAAG